MEAMEMEETGSKEIMERQRIRFWCLAIRERQEMTTLKFSTFVMQK